MTQIAFFDVDDTLIRPKSMFALLRFHLGQQGEEGDQRYAAIWAEISAMARRGVARAEINRHYYRLWAGASLSDVEAAGRAWFAAEMAGGNFFIAPAVKALRAHQAEGCVIALVSGSFPAALDPIAGWLGADHVLCTRPMAVAGRLTGDIAQPMIGPNKAEAAEALIGRLGSTAARCFAYGDHLSDLDLLDLVGMPGIVPHDPDLIAVATARNWKILQ